MYLSVKKPQNTLIKILENIFKKNPNTCIYEEFTFSYMLTLVLNGVVLYLIRNNKESWNQENPIVKSGSACVGPGSNADPEKLVNDCCENANVDPASDPTVKISQLKACKKCLKPDGWYSDSEV